MYEPPRQVSSVLLYWRSAEEWAQVLHDWVRCMHLLPLIYCSYLTTMRAL